MPVPGDRLECEVLARREVSFQAAQPDHDQHDRAHHHVQAVETGQHEEGRAVDAGAKLESKFVIRVSVLQDLNANRKLDVNFIGIPKEPSGSSNDAKATFSAPKFKDAVFTVGDQPVELRIRLN